MEQCFYGSGCTRANCFYRHDAPGAGAEKTNEPCMSFLAGQCTFAASGCKKRHPPKEEKERLIAKYKSMKCRYGKHCKTTGCLYQHEAENENGKQLAGPAAFPPLAGTNGVVPRTVAPTGAWKPTSITTAIATSNPPPPKPSPSAWKPSPLPVWGKGMNPVSANHASFPPPVNTTMTTGMVTPVSPRAAESPSMLNINAKEFVPGMF